MTIFRVIAAVAIAALLAAMAYDLRRRLRSWKAVREFLANHVRDSREAWRETKKTGARSTLQNLRSITYVVSAALMLFLAATGFLPILMMGRHLSGILLVVHVTIAPLFALSLSAFALLWAHRLRFDEWDWRIVEAPGGSRSPGNQMLVRLALKAGFWLVLSLSLPLMLTIILGLFPLFGTDGESLLIRLHGYSALLLMIAALTGLYLTIAYLPYPPGHSPKE